MSALAKSDGRRTARTREEIIEALQDYVATFGEAPTTAAFNPSVARWRDQEYLVARYLAGRRDGRPWPSLNSIKDLFDGKFNDALIAAGLPPNKPGPARGRRPAHQHGPIRDVRVQRVVVQSDSSKTAEARVRKAQERALQAEERARTAIERMRRVEADAGVETDEKTQKTIVRLREQVKAEKAEQRSLRKRIRALERQAAKPAPSPPARAPESSASLREVDRLTDLLATAQDRTRRLEAQVASSANHETRNTKAEKLQERLDSTQEMLDAARERAVDLKAQLTELQESSLAEALVDRRVRAAEQRAAAAQNRAAEAERQMSIQGAAVVGESRRLTTDEIDELRRAGPAGPVVLARALDKLRKVRRLGNSMLTEETLGELASAAIGWKDSIRR